MVAKKTSKKRVVQKPAARSKKPTRPAARKSAPAAATRPRADKKAKPSGKAVRSASKMPFRLIRSVADMKKFSREMRARGRKIALVPTMGSLHEGHASLIRQARKMASVVVVSVFVNPTQFGAGEDLDRYPRDLAGDRRRIRNEGGDVMFAPDVAEIYPEGYQTFVQVDEITRDLCGASRPGHFRGVTTVVARLLLMIQPHMAFFGEKDYQQLVTIQRMVRDLGLEVDVIGLPIVREEDGLAMSSRNVYLSDAQRLQATAIYRGLRKARRLCESGERDAAELAAVVLDLLREERDLEVEYVAVCDPDTLERIQEVERQAVVLVATRVGDTRLIDNIRLSVKRSR